MEILKMVITILFAIDCIALTAIVLLQEGKSAGLFICNRLYRIDSNRTTSGR